MAIQRVSQDNPLLARAAQAVDHWLSARPAMYKTAIVAVHFFRAAMMYAFMVMLPVNFWTNCAICVGAGVAYRVLIERACQFKFAIPSSLGAIAWMIAGKVTFIPFVLYATSVIALSSDEVEARLRSR